MKIFQSILKTLLVFVIFIVLFVVTMIITYFLTNLIVGDSYYFYEYDQFAYQMLAVLVLFPPLIIAVSIATKFRLISSVRKLEKNEELIYFWNRLGKWKILVCIVYFIIFLSTICSVNVVYSDKIVTKSLFNIKGTEYLYDDVEVINCGFGNSNFSFYEYKQKGNFYYQVVIDGKTITFSQPTPNTENNLFGDDTYLELEVFDTLLVSKGVQKKSSSDGVENCSYEQEYIDRFIRIIENK